MINLSLLRDNLDTLLPSLRAKGYTGDPAKLLELDDARKKLQSEFDELRAEQNRANDAISKASGDEKKEKITAMKAVAEQAKVKQTELASVEEELRTEHLKVPNPPKADVPVGKDDSENPVIETWGEPRVFDFTPRDHVALGELTDTIDTASAAEKTTGARFYFLKHELPLLEYALQQFVWRKLLGKNFIPLTTPMMIRGDAFAKARKIPGGPERIEEGHEFFRLADDPWFLVGTAEHITLNMHAGDTFEESELPRRYAAWSSCFRREAGAAGKDTRGILRVHQFEKLEMLVYTTPEKSEDEHRFLIATQKEIWQELGIPYRVVEACTGDMGFSDAKQYDIEAWFPGQETYREVTSGSNCTDFQARALNVKVKTTDGKKVVAHALNATGISMTRALIAIMENYQREDGSIEIPAVLHPYLPEGMKEIPVRKK